MALQVLIHFLILCSTGWKEKKFINKENLLRGIHGCALSWVSVPSEVRVSLSSSCACQLVRLGDRSMHRAERGTDYCHGGSSSLAARLTSPLAFAAPAPADAAAAAAAAAIFFPSLRGI